MDMKRIGKRIILLALTAALTAAMTGCRSRMRENPQEAGSTEGEQAGTGISEQAGQIPEDAGEEKPEKSEENGGNTRENPEASRKEYDENAPAEIVPGTDRALQTEGEGNGAPRPGDDGNGVRRENGAAEETALETVAAEEAEKKGVSEDAEAAESAGTYFRVLLAERTGSLYECQRKNVYLETEADHVTVHKSSEEHQMILEAGAYDVSSRLLAENLKVNDGWVTRKNPEVIVKITDSSVLGSGVSSTAAAAAVSRELAAREGWSGIDAVRNHRVLLISREMLEAPWLRLAAEILIARCGNRELFADVDPQKMMEMLAEEATGSLPGGIFHYQAGEE